MFTGEDFILPEALIVSGTDFLSPEAFREQFKKEYAAGTVASNTTAIALERKQDSDNRIKNYDRIDNPKTPILGISGDRLADGNHCMLYCQEKGISPVPVLVPRRQVDSVRGIIQQLNDDALLDQLYEKSKAFYEAKLVEKKKLNTKGNPDGSALFNQYTSSNSSQMPVQEPAQEIQVFNNLIRVQISDAKFAVFDGEWDLARSAYAEAYIKHQVGGKHCKVVRYNANANKEQMLAGDDVRRNSGLYDVVVAIHQSPQGNKIPAYADSIQSLQKMLANQARIWVDDKLEALIQQHRSQGGIPDGITNPQIKAKIIPESDDALLRITADLLERGNIHVPNPFTSVRKEDDVISNKVWDDLIAGNHYSPNQFLGHLEKTVNSVLVPEEISVGTTQNIGGRALSHLLENGYTGMVARVFNHDMNLFRETLGLTDRNGQTIALAYVSYGQDLKALVSNLKFSSHAEFIREYGLNNIATFTKHSYGAVLKELGFDCSTLDGIERYVQQVHRGDYVEFMDRNFHSLETGRHIAINEFNLSLDDLAKLTERAIAGQSPNVAGRIIFDLWGEGLGLFLETARVDSVIALAELAGQLNLKNGNDPHPLASFAKGMFGNEVHLVAQATKHLHLRLANETDFTLMLGLCNGSPTELVTRNGATNLQAFARLHDISPRVCFERLFGTSKGQDALTKMGEKFPQVLDAGSPYNPAWLAEAIGVPETELNGLQEIIRTERAHAAAKIAAAIQEAANLHAGSDKDAKAGLGAVKDMLGLLDIEATVSISSLTPDVNNLVPVIDIQFAPSADKDARDMAWAYLQRGLEKIGKKELSERFFVSGAQDGSDTLRLCVREKNIPNAQNFTRAVIRADELAFQDMACHQMTGVFEQQQASFKTPFERFDLLNVDPADVHHAHQNGQYSPQVSGEPPNRTVRFFQIWDDHAITMLVPSPANRGNNQKHDTGEANLTFATFFGLKGELAATPIKVIAHGQQWQSDPRLVEFSIPEPLLSQVKQAMEAQRQREQAAKEAEQVTGFDNRIRAILTFDATIADYVDYVVRQDDGKVVAGNGFSDEFNASGNAPRPFAQLAQFAPDGVLTRERVEATTDLAGWDALMADMQSATGLRDEWIDRAEDIAGRLYQIFKHKETIVEFNKEHGRFEVANTLKHGNYWRDVAPEHVVARLNAAMKPDALKDAKAAIEDEFRHIIGDAVKHFEAQRDVLTQNLVTVQASIKTLQDFGVKLVDNKTLQEHLGGFETDKARHELTSTSLNFPAHIPSVTPFDTPDPKPVPIHKDPGSFKPTPEQTLACFKNVLKAAKMNPDHAFLYHGEIMIAHVPGPLGRLQNSANAAEKALKNAGLVASDKPVRYSDANPAGNPIKGAAGYVTVSLNSNEYGQKVKDAISQWQNEQSNTEHQAALAEYEKEAPARIRQAAHMRNIEIDRQNDAAIAATQTHRAAHVEGALGFMVAHLDTLESNPNHTFPQDQLEALRHLKKFYAESTVNNSGTYKRDVALVRFDTSKPGYDPERLTESLKVLGFTPGYTKTHNVTRVTTGIYILDQHPETLEDVLTKLDTVVGKFVSACGTPSARLNDAKIAKVTLEGQRNGQQETVVKERAELIDELRGLTGYNPIIMQPLELPDKNLIESSFEQAISQLKNSDIPR
ncbi:hypothetical protein GC177_08100 [bacterium]|nr:hypothetical protein [bacterium]